MSGEESDSLEFESADEDVVGEDIDLAELGLDDSEDETDSKKQSLPVTVTVKSHNSAAENLYNLKQENSNDTKQNESVTIEKSLLDETSLEKESSQVEIENDEVKNISLVKDENNVKKKIILDKDQIINEDNSGPSSKLEESKNFNDKKLNQEIEFSSTVKVIQIKTEPEVLNETHFTDKQNVRDSVEEADEIDKILDDLNKNEIANKINVAPSKMDEELTPPISNPSHTEYKDINNFSIQEEDDEVNTMLQDMNLNELIDKIDDSLSKISDSSTIGKSTHQTLKKEDTSSSDTNTKKNEVIKSGWEDTEFEDLDDELVEEQPKINETKGTSETKNEITLPQKEIPKQPEVKQNTWSWSKFGSSFMNTATNLTSTLGTGLNSVLETVEATIGAPDPTELAKVSKSNTQEKISQHEKEAPVEAKENKDEKNDWINDDDGQEWFSFTPFNKLTSTVN